MKSQLVTKEQYNSLKDLGFEWKHPTQDLACKWFREIHKFHLTTYLVWNREDGNYLYSFLVRISRDPLIHETGTNHDTHEEAINEGITYLLEILNKQTNKQSNET